MGKNLFPGIIVDLDAVRYLPYSLKGNTSVRMLKKLACVHFSGVNLMYMYVIMYHCPLLLGNKMFLYFRYLNH